VLGVVRFEPRAAEKGVFLMLGAIYELEAGP
jgi:hypothetical protein